MYKTINESIEFTSTKEFEHTCKNRVVNYSAVAPISIISDSYEDDRYYWCRVLKVNSTSVVEKYVYVWDKESHDWQYAYNVFALSITE